MRASQTFPLVVGAGAEKAASDFLALTDRFPALRDQVRAYVMVAERRWNLRLKNDIRHPPAGIRARRARSRR
jgi:cell division protein FtsQ